MLNGYDACCCSVGHSGSFDLLAEVAQTHTCIAFCSVLERRDNPEKAQENPNLVEIGRLLSLASLLEAKHTHHYLVTTQSSIRP